MSDSYVSPLIPTWKNCRGDVNTYAHARTVQMFLDSVAIPAIRAIEGRLDELRRSEEPLAVFEAADLEDLRTATLSSLCLSLQSLWERQFRSYLEDCASELAGGEPSLVTDLQLMRWPDLKKQFLKFRKIALSDFRSARDLDLLQHLGNFCRHGEGTASRAIRSQFPEFCTPVPAPLPGTAILPARLDIVINIEDLTRFGEAVISFWTDVKWIYNNSIGRKHESLVRAIQEYEKALLNVALV